jgi:hypothetical protein
MAKNKETNAVETTEVVTPAVEKTPRVRKVILTPVATETTLALTVEVIGQEVINYEVEVSELPVQLLNQLALRGLTSFIHDKTAGAKDVSTIPAEVAKVLASIKDGTIFENTRKRGVDTVELPKFVEAIMVRDNLNREDKAVRQEALDAWNSLSKEDKTAIRSDAVLMNHVKILNGEEAVRAIEAAKVKANLDAGI